MRASGPIIISMLRDQLQIAMGRHMYGVLGTYEQLSQFEEVDLAQAKDPLGIPFPPPTNVSQQLLARIGDQDLRKLVNDEAKRPQAIQYRLNRELNGLLRDLFDASHFVVLKHLELMYAYKLDFGALRTHASNQNHLLLLLPGERRGDHVVIFHEAETDFHKAIPVNLIPENHLWELANG